MQKGGPPQRRSGKDSSPAAEGRGRTRAGSRAPAPRAAGSASKAQEVTIGGRRLSLTNLSKVLYPEAGFTKAEVIDYYSRIAPVLLPHLKGRPLTMKRYPDGVDRFFFYEKNCPAHRPDWVKTLPVWSDGNETTMHYCNLADLPTLVWAANLASLELHPSLSLGKALSQPTMVVFDLDPGAPAALLECCEVALLLRDRLQALGLRSFVKTSGSKGLQLYVPLNTKVVYEGEGRSVGTKDFARAMAEVLERQRPHLVVSNMKKSLRVGKVLVDWSQNDEHKTTVGVYSLRAKERPTVSTPVAWEEVEQGLKKGDPALLRFEAADVLARVEAHGDLFAEVLTLRQKLPSP